MITNTFKIFFAAAVLGFTANIQAQNYTSGVGVIFEGGKEGNFIGAQYKHFFTEYGAGEFSALAGKESVLAQANFQFQYPLMRNIDWYVGAGPGVMYGPNRFNNEKSFYFAPAGMIGLDVKFGDTPLALSADWRPRVFLGKDQYTAIGRFGAGLKYTF